MCKKCEVLISVHLELYKISKISTLDVLFPCLQQVWEYSIFWIVDMSIPPSNMRFKLWDKGVYFEVIVILSKLCAPFRYVLNFWKYMPNKGFDPNSLVYWTWKCYDAIRIWCSMYTKVLFRLKWLLINLKQLQILMS